MNTKITSLALVAAMSVLFVAPAMAQDNFPDVPENHWAYEALENLKREGILVGYPDGTYKGPRALTRYELAVALNAAYQRMKNITDGLAEQIAEIRRNSNSGGDAGVSDRLAAVERQLKGMGSMSDDMNAMKKMADEFQKELAGLGVDVEAMKKDIDAMKKMMGGTSAVTISGDANIYVVTGQGDSDGFGVDQAGRVYGVDGESSNRGGFLNSAAVYHEIAFNLAGTASDNFKWDATVVHGNLLGGDTNLADRGFSATQGFGNQSQRFGATAFTEGASDTYIQRFVIDLTGALPFQATVGRQAWASVNPYVFKRTDQTPYFKNDRWDDGKWLFDGVILGWNFGDNAKLSVFGGRSSNRRTNNGVEIQPITFGTVSGGSSSFDSIVRDSAGAELSFGLGDKGSLAATYTTHSLVGSTDSLSVFGASLGFQATDAIKVKGNYAASNPDGFGADKKAYNFGLDYKGGAFDLNVGYRKVEAGYLAAGSWERIGTNWSPRGIEDYQIGLGFNAAGAKISLRGIFGELEGSNNKYSSLIGKVDYGFGGGWSGMLGYEAVKVEAGVNDTKQNWFNVGLGYAMSANSMFNLNLGYSDLKGPSWGGVGSLGKGYFVTSQVSIKF